MVSPATPQIIGGNHDRFKPMRAEGVPGALDSRNRTPARSAAVALGDLRRLLRNCWRDVVVDTEPADSRISNSHASEPKRDFPFRFRCRRSGNCCARPEGLVRVSPADITQIADHLRMSEAAVRARFVSASGDRLIDAAGGRCPFLEDGRHTSCRIYAVRPQKCRSWPFWEEFLHDPRALRDAARLCPGIELSSPPLPLHPKSDSADD